MFFMYSVCIAQNSKTRIIQVNGRVDFLGNINMQFVENPFPNSKTIDTLVNFKSIKKIISINYTAIKVINALAGEGWVLMTTMYVPRDENSGGPPYPFIVYYFKKEF
jgi:hypothetical protein